MANYGFIKTAAATPKLKVGNPEYNVGEIQRLMQEAEEQKVVLLVFPELCITGYTCGDLFGQTALLNGAFRGLLQLAEQTRDTQVLTLVGLPLLVEQKLYNCAVLLQAGQILGIVPKMYLPNHKEFYEKRWFTSGQGISSKISEISLQGESIPFGNLIFECEAFGFSLGVELCEDLWSVIPPSSYQALSGATIIANLSASNELVSKSDYRRQLVAQQSGRCMCGYIYASSGVHESTTDNVFGGDCIIAENGTVVATSQRFNRDNTLILADLDYERLLSERLMNKTFFDNLSLFGQPSYRKVKVQYARSIDVEKASFHREISAHPFIPENPLTRDERCQEIFNIQVAGLAKRLEHTGAQCAVLGISGGLDSTLALLVVAKTFELLGKPPEQIMAITMPGFGTTDTTYANALQLMRAMHVTIREIDIKPACIQHFADIGHDVHVHNVTYENVQARERTQVLMDIANQQGGLVIGTGDLSELALGWSTYNGDHMSMYGVNAGVPKTLVKFLVKWVADHVMDVPTKEVLDKIIATPISPELLPPDAQGEIQQKTEDVVGPYELHDFFLYYVVRFGMPPKKVMFLADKAFAGKYAPDEIKAWLKVFYRRFFSQQFKRSCLPDGPKVGTISLSPRGDWRMPSDADVQLWLKELD